MGFVTVKLKSFQNRRRRQTESPRFHERAASHDVMFATMRVTQPLNKHDVFLRFVSALR